MMHIDKANEVTIHIIHLYKSLNSSCYRTVFGPLDVLKHTPCSLPGPHHVVLQRDIFTDSLSLSRWHSFASSFFRIRIMFPSISSFYRASFRSCARRFAWTSALLLSPPSTL
jgi:hypothetical protein